MSFVHSVRVGFFGPPHDNHPNRDLQISECAEMIREYNGVVPPELHVAVEATPRGHVSRGMILGAVEGHPLVLKSGVLFCPYLTTHFIPSAIGLAAYLHKYHGCSIYSDDDGRFLTLEEFVPKQSFADIMRHVMQEQSGPLAPSAGG